MPEQVRITSVEAIEAFRTDLVVYLDKARNVVDEVSEEITRTRAWLQDDRGRYWAQQVKRRTLDLEARQQELFSAQLANTKRNIQGELVAVRRAKQALEEAEAKVKVIKQWLRDYPVEIEPQGRHADLLRHALANDMGKAVGLLSQMVETLHGYSELKPPSADLPAPPPPAE